MRALLLPFLLLFTAILLPLSSRAQVNFTANTVVTPYNQPFRPGVNTDFIPGWDNFKLADISAGNASLQVPGLGSKAIRPGMFELVFDFWGYHINRDLFDYYEALGMSELTGLIDLPSDAHRDQTQYCPGIPSSMWANMYDPIWDGGANGTPVNDNNHYALFLYRMVTAYKDQVRFWEIMNEPGFDFTGYKGWQQPGVPGNWWDANPDPCDYKLRAPIQHYVRLLRISWEIIKTYDPDSYVLASGLGYPAFLDAILRNTDNPNGGTVNSQFPLFGGAYFDAVGFHSYPHFDGSLWATGQQRRNSDGAANGVIFKLNEYQQVLTNRGYNGNPYPRKHWLITEINTPRKNITGQQLTEDEGQRNFIIKAIVNCKKNDVKQFHVFSLSDQKTEADATYEFDLFGLYKRLHEEGLYNQKPNNEAHAFKTATDLLFPTTYDAARTAALNLPQGVLGGAFRNADGTFIYCLWAEALQDLSENANRSYSFPSGLGISSVQKRDWNHSSTGITQTISGNNIALTAAPVFLSPQFPVAPCNLVAVESNKSCSDRNTPTNEYDDTYSFDITVTGGSGQGWTAQVNGVTVSGQNGVAKTVGPFLIANGITNLTVRDAANANCTAKVIAGAPLPCSQAGLPATYCTPTGTPGQSWIGRFVFGNINKSSGASGYSNFTTDLNSQSRVLGGAGFPIAMTSNYTPNTAPQAVFWKVWIDYNRNGIFEEGPETSFTGTTPAQTFGTTVAHLTGSINIPTTVTPGAMRMRVAMNRGSAPTPCGTGIQGEVEDYLIIGDTRGGQACTLYPQVYTNQCLDQGTIGGSDDRFRVSLLVNGWNSGTSWEVTGANGQTYTNRYGTPTNVGDFVPGNGPVTLTVRDKSLGNCTASVTVTPPVGCGTSSTVCVVGTEITNLACANNGTPNNPNDDTFSFSIAPTGTNAGNQGWTATMGAQNRTGAYNVSSNFSGIPIGTGAAQNLVLRDVQTPNCMVSIPVTPPATCSSGGGGTPCASQSLFPWHEWIAGVKIGTIDNVSGKSTYSNFTTSSTNLTTGVSTPITLTSGFSWFTYPEYWKIWIDWNRNGILEDPAEVVFQQIQAKAADGTPISPFSGSIQLPNSAQTGSALMRVSMKRGSYPNPCESVPEGEVEDYTVQIQAGGGPQPCSISGAISAITCNNNGTNSNASDDTFSFTLTASGTNTGTGGWSANVAGQTVTGAYNTLRTLSGFPISGGNLTITLRDAVTNTCQTTVNVAAPAPCSNGGGPVTPCASASDFPWHDWIAGVQIGGFSNPSSKSSFSNFSNLTIPLAKSQTTPLTLTTGYSWVTYDEYWKIWIDYNKDGAFNEATETAYSGTMTAPANGTSSKNITGTLQVPNSAQSGTTKMRVSMKRGSFPIPCETLPFGEVEEYTVNIASSQLAAGTEVATNNDERVLLQTSSDGVLLYPNPANDQVRIVWAEEMAHVQLYDFAGRRLAGQMAFGEMDFDLSSLAEGWYVVKIEVWGKRPVVRKFEIIR